MYRKERIAVPPTDSVQLKQNKPKKCNKVKLNRTIWKYEYENKQQATVEIQIIQGILKPIYNYWSL